MRMALARGRLGDRAARPAPDLALRRRATASRAARCSPAPACRWAVVASPDGRAAGADAGRTSPPPSCATTPACSPPARAIQAAGPGRAVLLRRRPGARRPGGRRPRGRAVRDRRRAARRPPRAARERGGMATGSHEPDWQACAAERPCLAERHGRRRRRSSAGAGTLGGGGVVLAPAARHGLRDLLLERAHRRRHPGGRGDHRARRDQAGRHRRQLPRPAPHPQAHARTCGVRGCSTAACGTLGWRPAGEGAYEKASALRRQLLADHEVRAARDDVTDDVWSASSPRPDCNSLTAHVKRSVGRRERLTSPAQSREGDRG